MLTKKSGLQISIQEDYGKCKSPLLNRDSIPRITYLFHTTMWIHIPVPRNGYANIAKQFALLSSTPDLQSTYIGVFK